MIYPPLRPPAARKEREFLRRCIRCGQCVELCPHGTLELLDGFGEAVAGKVQNLGFVPPAELPVAVKGCEPIRPYYKPRDREGNFINILKVKPVTDLAKCGGCGLCAQKCPMGSIAPDNVAEVAGICIKCCACVKGCPTGAKYFTDEGYLYHQHELEEMYQRRAEVDMFL